MITYLIRMYQYHRKENRIFFLSQSLGIALLQFVEIFVNDSSFMEHYAVVGDVLIDMMRLLEVLIIVSVIIFIILSHWYLLRNQAKEFTTFQCAGMSKEETIYLYLAEFLVIDVLALLLGIVFGSILANSCYGFLKAAFGMPLKLPLAGYEEVRKAVLIVVFSDACAAIWMILFSPLKRRKSRQTHETMYMKCIVIVTAALLLFALATHWKMDGIIAVMALVPVLLCLDFAVLRYGIMRWKRKDTQGIMQVEKALILEALKNNCGVILTAGAVFSLVLIFVCGFFMDIHYWDKDVYSQQNPFDLVIVNYEIMPDLKENQITEIVGKAESPVIYSKEIFSIRDGAFNFFSVNDVNDILHTHYQVKKGGFIQVFRVYGSYKRKDFLSTEMIQNKINGKPVTLKKEGETDNILFGYSKSMADQTILLNQSDYQMLCKKGTEELKQDVYLYRFQDWKKTGGAVCELKHILGDGEAYSIASSKIEGYQHVREGYIFFAVTIVPIMGCLFLFGFLQFQFAMRLQAEKDEKEFYRLNCLGIGTEDRNGIKHRLLRALYTKPYILAVLNGVYFIVWYLAVS